MTTRDDPPHWLVVACGIGLLLIALAIIAFVSCEIIHALNSVLRG